MALAAAQAVAGSCDADHLTIRGDFGQARFAVSVADDPAERAQGLMNVPEMPLMTGMLFAYEQANHATFWMKNTLIPLDMLFADDAGVIRRIHAEAVPMDETTIDGGEGVRYVLEINGGLAARLGIAEGDTLQHPLIGPDAADPCE